MNTSCQCAYLIKEENKVYLVHGCEVQIFTEKINSPPTVNVLYEYRQWLIQIQIIR